MNRNPLVQPFVKWVGGKRQLIDEIEPLLPERFSTYCEPFLGGGAVLFHLQPSKAIVNDLNEDLIIVYETIRDDLEDLIASLKKHENNSDYYYKIRDLDRDKKAYKKMSKVEKASRILYLNKTCYNGLFRVNSAGEFNVPFGNYKSPNIVNEPTLRAVSQYLSKRNIQFFSKDYDEVLRKLRKGTFVYLDPPYDPVSDTSSFTGYNKGGFDKEEQIRLKECCDRLNEKGIRFMLSNSNTNFIRELYKEYEIVIVSARRNINSDSKKRGEIEEVIVRNYE